MKINNKIIGTLSVSALAFLCTIVYIRNENKVAPKKIVITLSNTDTIYQEIEKIKLKSDTIILKHETQINTYRQSSTTNKIQLFADRINR
jgi:3-keto-L-gulonate-6-phosphate decarboxylase